MYFFGEHARWRRRFTACMKAQNALFYHGSRTCVIHGALDCVPCTEAWYTLSRLKIAPVDGS